MDNFENSYWPQNCGDILKILKKSTEKTNKGEYYWICQFQKYPCIIKARKGHIQNGQVNNPEIENVNFIGKGFLQNCGDSLKVLEKTNIKDNSGNYLFKCEFQRYNSYVLVRKNKILSGNVENPNLPWKSKETLEHFIKTNFSKKVSIEELAKALKISYPTINHAINNFGLTDYIKYEFGKQEETLKIFLQKYISVKKLQLKEYEIDCYIPSLKIGFEYNGSYWHSELFKESNYHQEKSLLLLEKYQIKIFHIWDWEFEDIKIQNYIKHKIIGGNIKIYARQCKIKEIEKEEYKNFCDKYHLQNYEFAKVKLGLFYKDELVQIMSFGLSRFNKSYEYELIRECSKYNHIIVGGVEKLWNFFLKNYNPQSIISYCDFNKFNGKSYEKLGFKLQKINLDFVWWDSIKNICYWRNPYNHQNMKSLIKIWRAGQMSYVWNK